MNSLCLDVAKAAGDYAYFNLMCYSGGTVTTSYMLQWAATAKSNLAMQPSFAAIQKGFSLVNSGFT